jgi:putative oxidoreductase
MKRMLGGFEGTFFALLRIVAGFMFACHGAQKLFGVLGKGRATSTFMQFAGVLEFGLGILIAVGLFTGIAAFLASGEMAVAYFRAHAPQGFWPILNGGELAALYCFLFLYIAAHGAGKWSIDGLKRRAP